MRLFGGWIHATERLQIESYAMNLRKLRGADAAAELRLNVLAATVELAELLQETRWKPWQLDQGIPDEVRQRAKIELADILHFAANIAVLLDTDDAEMSQIYLDKIEKNRARVEEGEHAARS